MGYTGFLWLLLGVILGIVGGRYWRRGTTVLPDGGEREADGEKREADSRKHDGTRANTHDSHRPDMEYIWADSETDDTSEESQPVAAALAEGTDLDRRYRTLTKNFPRGILALFDENGQYLISGGQLYRELDHDPDDFVGRTIEEGYVDEFVDRWAEDFYAVFDGVESTFEFRHGDQYFRKHLVPVRDDDGSVVVGMEITKDITDLRERERALRESEQRYRTLAENFPRGVVALFDKELRYELVDGGVFEYIDLSTGDFEGNRIDEVHTEGYVDLHGEQFERCLEGESCSFTFTHGDRIYRTQLVPVPDEDGTIGQGMSISTDVTELKERERELERQNERLDDFVSILSHDLRNPLQVLDGRLTLLGNEVESEHLEKARVATDRMDELIDDLLALARHGQRVTEPEPVPLTQAVETAWSTVDTKDATLVDNVEALVVDADPGRLRQLLENCFRNSVEHGSTSNRPEADDAVDHGPRDVTVTVGRLESDEGFYVADDGPGIPPEQREKVFEHGYSTASGGTGLGLAIVSEIVEAHGWTIDVTESSSGGARFEISTEPSVPAE